MGALQRVILHSAQDMARIAEALQPQITAETQEQPTAAHVLPLKVAAVGELQMCAAAAQLNAPMMQVSLTIIPETCYLAVSAGQRHAEATELGLHAQTRAYRQHVAIVCKTKVKQV